MKVDQEQKPRKISEGIENTLEGVLNFIMRYFRTIWVITMAPHRALSIAYATRLSSSYLVHSLTFLAIGSFLFALLIGVYPEGIKGVLDFVWITDEISKNVGAKWQDALSPTKMITTGLPIILMVSLCASIVSRVTLVKNKKRHLLFDVICLSFGYQCVLVFIALSTESIVQAVQIIFLIPDIDFSEDGGLQYGVMGFFISLIILIIINPIVMLYGALLKLDCRRSWLKSKISVLMSSILISLFIFGLYTNAGSVPSALTKSNTVKKIVDGYYLEPIELMYSSDDGVLRVQIPFVIHNQLKSSVVIESFESPFLITTGNNEDEYIEEWDFKGNGFRKNGTSHAEKWVTIAPEETTIITGEYSLPMSEPELRELITKLIVANEGTSSSIFVKYDVSIRDNTDDVDLDMSILLGDINFRINEKSVGIEEYGNEKYNKALKRN